ncbi:MAG: pilus assembly protein TadG-related protein [Pirellulaceae bacterium]
MLRRISRSLTRIASDVYHGDEPWEGDDVPRPTSRWSRLHSDEGGKITLISTITLLFFLLLVCYVGNVGVAVKEKMELQNAADSAAYSSALWMARGMNAVTVTNHMLGEATAMVVIIDSFGGELLEKNVSDSKKWTSSQSQDYNEYLDANEVKGATLRDMAPISGPSSSGLRSLDKELVDGVADDLSEDDGEHTAGATIFDAQLTLKFVTVAVLATKSLLSLVSKAAVIPVLAWIEPICIVGHFAASALLLKIWQEWLFLKAIESVVGVMIPLKQSLEKYLIPAVGAYGESVAGESPLGLPGGIGDTIVGRSVAKTLADLEREQVGRPLTLQLAPTADTLRLPVEAEPAPATSEGQQGVVTWEMPPSEWDDGRFFTHPDLKNVIETYGEIKGWVEGIQKYLKSVSKFLLNPLNSIPGMNGGDVNKALGELDKISAFTSLPDEPDRRNGYKTNPSHDEDSDFRLPDFDWQTERKSQWTRATYPYVNSFRAPILEWMIEGFGILNLRISDAATYYGHWTNRYTLAVVYEIRSGKRSDGDAPKMYVLRGMQPDQKGYEPWTNDRDEAAKMFAVHAVAHREHAPTIFGPGLFTDPNDRGNAAVAAAMFYNANGRDVPSNRSSGNPSIQSNTGWDTLNWQPPIQAREWGGERPEKKGSNISSLFTGNLPALPSARVQTNWQSKLIPLAIDHKTPRALHKASLGPTGTLDGQAREIVEDALRDVELLNH